MNSTGSLATIVLLSACASTGGLDSEIPIQYDDDRAATYTLAEYVREFGAHRGWNHTKVRELVDSVHAMVRSEGESVEEGRHVLDRSSPDSAYILQSDPIGLMIVRQAPLFFNVAYTPSQESIDGYEGLLIIKNDRPEGWANRLQHEFHYARADNLGVVQNLLRAGTDSSIDMQAYMNTLLQENPELVMHHMKGFQGFSSWRHSNGEVYPWHLHIKEVPYLRDNPNLFLAEALGFTTCETQPWQEECR